ncbi:MAG: hypothetical protein P0Y50_08785 [Candidatus Brevundimonas colombiensis]|uniref:Uncharacterized protein n=1 Tax=Candidatus Brevundimonas colombiensis TaxID=3121376 RepID=A0AAJ6BJT1_9CAUL|nr:hypothetical protein [Brevundimonas sp.]WEK38647.1 MAG: hypothetical protein P0Y50_08785 [Brevundimonas sp.]
MSAAPTRAQSLGVKPAQMRRGSVSRINKAKASLVEVIGIWADIDEGMVGEVESMISRLDGLNDSLDASVELLREEWPE